MIEKLIDLLGSCSQYEVEEVCNSFDHSCDDNCVNCPFYSADNAKKTAKSLKELIEQ